MKPHSLFFRLFVINLVLVGAIVVLLDFVAYRAIALYTDKAPGELIALSTLAAVAGAAVLAGLIRWTWYKPIRDIAAAARSIATGDLSARAGLLQTADLGELTGAIHEMRDSLSRQIELIAAQRESLQTVIANLSEGVIATNAAGDIVLANQAAIGLLLPADAASPLGKRLASVARSPDIIDLYNRSQSAGKPARAAVELLQAGLRRSLDIEAIPVPGKGQAIAGLLVVRDVTEQVRTAAMKAEFVANASHELRTPLATLRAAVDNLAGMGVEDAQDIVKLAGMLDRHVKRLEDMTRDLLDLHILETGRRPLRMEPTAVASIIQWLRTNFAQRAYDKKIDLQVLGEPSASLLADRGLVELILQNLADNALKFTPEGGQVKVVLDVRDAAATITVCDSGCGIPVESQSRVFERFFQVDTARSGEPRVRGTGLGLAIVKHAVDRLHGTVALQSEPGKGTTVTVVLPNTAARS